MNMMVFNPADFQFSCNIILSFFTKKDFHDVVPASMWTRKDIREFKESINREGKDSIIKVGHGETVTVSLLSAT